MPIGTIIEKKAAFRAVATEHLDRLYATARRFVDDDAEDAVQEALLKAYRSFDSLQDVSAAGPWLMQILVNCCRDVGRIRGREPLHVDVDQVDEFSLYRTIAREDPFPYSDSLHLDFLERFGREDVHAVLLMIPEVYRLPLVLVHMAGYSTKETAKIADVPLGTMLSRLHRGRKLFEKTMWRYATDKGLLKEKIR